jgi:hypothetical protein
VIVPTRTKKDEVKFSEVLIVPCDSLYIVLYCTEYVSTSLHMQHYISSVSFVEYKTCLVCGAITIMFSDFEA